MNGAFWKAGHPPTLVATFLYFDLSFMVWVMLGPLAVQISQQLGLTPTQKGLMVAVPVLAGALLRIVMGVLVDHLKPKRAGSLGQVVVIAGLFWAWYIGVRTYADVLALGLVLDGHDVIAVALLVRGPGERAFHETPMCLVQ